MLRNTNLFEANLSGDRIYKIFNQSIKNITMLTALQQFEQRNWDVLKTKMPPGDFLTLRDAYKKNTLLESLELINEPVSCDSKSDTESIEKKRELGTIIQILNKYKEASEYCLQIEPSQGAYKFIKHLERFLTFMRERIDRSAEMEKKHQHHLKQLYEQNLTMSETLTKLQDKIDALESRKKDLENAKENDLTRHNTEIESIRKAFKQRIKDKITESENQMLIDWKNSEFRQAALMEELTGQETYYDNIVKERLAREKELRIRRYKIESQLVAVLEKYDNDIGDRHNQKEKLIASLDEEKLELEQLQERFNEQEITYNKLMTEKELHEKAIFDEKIYNIRSRMAARVIQRRFRKYLERKSKGKKKGKGKGGKGKKK